MMYLKSFKFKKAGKTPNDNRPQNVRQAIPECLKIAGKCPNVKLDELFGSLNEMEEVSIEWDVTHEPLEFCRTFCRTVVWLALIGAIVFATAKFVH